MHETSIKPITLFEFGEILFGSKCTVIKLDLRGTYIISLAHHIFGW